jgi:predicted benzoate:H+ symporter BenE
MPRIETECSQTEASQKNWRSPTFGALLPLTIAIPTYNRCQLVVTLVQQLLPQLLPNDELLIVDDGSQDATAETLRSIPQVKLVSNPSNTAWSKPGIVVLQTLHRIGFASFMMTIASLLPLYKRFGVPVH